MPATGTIKPSSNLPVLGGSKSTDSLFTPKNVLGNTTAMKRLVYTPRAYVFIKDSSGQIHDLTHYVVSGSVDRLVDQVSTAEITLRNPNHLFTTHLEGKEVIEAKFSPMDPITIYLRRVRNRAVRVFTGFLDDVPYLQLFPGTVTLKASCTLKRLLHTYFDPALPYTQSFLTSYGWIPYNGQWVSLTGMQDWLAPGTNPATVKSNPNQSTKTVGKSGGVTLIGDSIAEGVASVNSFSSSNALRGRPTSAGIALLRTYAKYHNLPETVVLCLGSNDDPTNPDAFKALVRQAVKIVGPSRHLIWVNLHGTNAAGHSLTTLNPPLDDVAADNPNMTIIHWNTIVEDENLTMDSHGLHTNTAGYSRLANEISKVADKGALQGGQGNTLQAPKSIDGSLSQLLFATLEHIGHWNPNDIYIEAMPERLFDHLRDLATEFAKDSEQAKAEFKKFITNVIGGSSHGSATGGAGASLGGQVKGIDKITQTIVRIANKYNIDAAMAMAVADIESTYGTNMFTHEPYHGWYQIDIGGSRYSPPISIAQANDLQYSCTLFCKGAVGTVSASVKQQGPLAWAMATQGVNGTNNPLYPQEWPTAYAKAKKLIAQYGTGGLSGSLPDNTATLGTAGGRDVTVRSDKKGGTAKGDTTSKVYAPIPAWDNKTIGGVYGEPRSSPHPHIHAGVDIDVPRGSDCVAPVDGTIGIAASGGFAPGEGGPDGAGGGMVHFIFDSDVGTIKAGTVIGWGHIEKLFVSSGQKVKAGKVIAKSGWTNGGDHVHFITRHDDSAMDGYQDKSMDPTPIINALQQGDTNPTGTAPNAGTGATGGSTASDPTAQQAGAAGAFFAALDLPSAFDAVEASMLTGEKSLLNDKPLLPFIQQLCSASLRHFQSLPDGRFYAFYPDYFGELNQHPPYWNIEDIEILDGKINISDGPLVTHQYVVGDTVTPMTGDTPFAMRSVFSSGVVTVFNAFMANSVLDRTKARAKDKQKAERKAKSHKDSKSLPSGMGILLDRQEVAAFLQRYGARPVVEDMPMIKSPYYEMFLAYQKFLLAWSKQFSTPFMFTFMPELFPGGKVAFPNHGLQMYIEQVNHSWDYESGFTTTASLSAPSVYGKNTGLLPPNMVQAIIGPATKGSG